MGKDCTVAVALKASCDDAFNATAHENHKHGGVFFVHKTQDNTIITTPQCILWRSTSLMGTTRVTPEWRRNGVSDPSQIHGELVKEARKAEMEHFRKMGVCTKVSKKRWHDVTGKAPRTDVHKEDDASPLYRSRLVAQDVNTAAHRNSAAGAFANAGESGDKQERKVRWRLVVVDVCRINLSMRQASNPRS